MSDPSALSVAVDAVGLVARRVAHIQWSWYFSCLLGIIAWPWKLVLAPLSFFASVLAVVFAPLLYLLSYIISWVHAVLAFLISLEPLYTFFTVAAAVGLVAGMLSGVFSSTIISYLGMQGPNDDDERALGAFGRRKQDKLLEQASTDSEWQWLESSAPGRRAASGLLSETIHEEDDDSE